jgi:hypothetical protein
MALTKKLKVDSALSMRVSIKFRIFYFPVLCLKTEIKIYTKLELYLF